MHAAAGIALALLTAFGVLGFGWRSWLQYRRTGSAGLRRISGGPIEWLAGAGFVLALAVTVSAPLAQLGDLIAPPRVLNDGRIQAAGIVIALGGIAATVYAQLVMGDSWRIGVDKRETTPLVTTGIFGRVRNPIYTAMFVFALGITLVTPNVVALIGFVLLVATVELQVRRVEEPHLRRVHGDTYAAYTESVGRFVPGVGLIR
ncbi:methyltransferase family protein [Mycobacterium sherrisii]|uniref:Isoprenylcysteine carboxyl methyltransferase n=1 Tax=Mycobacterium sherrisii TaxID=243061 RepID=A0A1E3T5I5_9MYCO|nr:isoprenylcysteine carboxylmethyltransferase family protein [Mycobacterium sherrisii]MCV7029747.1 isoprenylcysteine carboxylmethyltransferase family protein [Mycobacterium sherrisii]MEC4762368.1 isoprenylcysteine carboxylmethyltransferase family protein [Mycobacterium sherrisii]ODR09729.1 isoprenylcysteine carboxyl methyltransferase [Mycobacterium sherrisii]ORW75024.1 isoprenylcysteine carboxyl methyltransferase [Mycobacterium sherrisii]